VFPHRAADACEIIPRHFLNLPRWRR